MLEKKKQKSQYTKSNKDDQIDEELRDDQMFGADDIRKKIDAQKERQIKSRLAKQEEVQKKLGKVVMNVSNCVQRSIDEKSLRSSHHFCNWWLEVIFH